MKHALMDFFRKIGKQSEFDLFLKLFHQIPKSQFAVIKISGQTIENHLDTIAEDIAFLNKMDLYPIVVHGAGSSLDKKLPDSKRINGYRVTSEKDMQVIQSTFQEIAQALSEKIHHKGGFSKVIPPVFQCDPIPELGSVGSVKNVDLKKIKECIELNHSPIISPLGMNGDAFLNINADTAAKEIVKKTLVKKLILLTETGGILGPNGKILSFLNLSDLDDMSYITGGMNLKIREVADFLQDHSECEVVITSAVNLLKEIFTIKGKGTFIKYYEILEKESLNSLDKEKIKILLEEAFSKDLVDNYFENEFHHFFIEKNYEGIAIIDSIEDTPYLDKIAVSKPMQGTGLGKAIWEKALSRYPSLIWRAARDNPFNKFYVNHCDGMIKKEEWIVFWKNLPDEKVWPLAQRVNSARKTLLERDK